MKHVIIGNGVAGVTAAETIRRCDPGSEIVMVADEAFSPYCRPMISLVLEGSIKQDQLPIRGARFYEDNGIEPVLGRRVAGIDVENKTVFVPGRPLIPYDKLLIASGADPRPIRARNQLLKHIFFMRTEAHVRGMMDAVPRTNKALVLGGGLVGFKAAYGLLRQGKKVTMLIRSGYPLSMQADEVAGKRILDELTAKGLDVRVGVEATEFEGNETVSGAGLSDGSRVDCDMVVMGKGVLPALNFVPRDRIDVDLGIMVDAHMETSAKDIYAAGDVAEFIDIARQTRWVNAIWPEAAAQGRIAGMNMAGRPVAYPGSLSRNVMRIFDLDVMTGGLVNPPDADAFEVLARTDTIRNTYRKLVFREDVLVGMVMVGDVEQGGVLLSLMGSQTPVTIPKSRILEPGFNYRRLLP